MVDFIAFRFSCDYLFAHVGVNSCMRDRSRMECLLRVHAVVAINAISFY